MLFSSWVGEDFPGQHRQQDMRTLVSLLMCHPGWQLLHSREEEQAVTARTFLT